VFLLLFGARTAEVRSKRTKKKRIPLTPNLFRMNVENFMDKKGCTRLHLLMRKANLAAS
jgi:hypothetical protein